MRVHDDDARKKEHDQGEKQEESGQTHCRERGDMPPFALPELGDELGRLPGSSAFGAADVRPREAAEAVLTLRAMEIVTQFKRVL